MEITAAVTPGTGEPFKIKTLELDDPRPNEVRVKLTATGVCHTDAIVRDQVYPTPLPAVLGHEGAGIVESVGDAVTTIQPGDHVVLGFNSCGECTQCPSALPVGPPTARTSMTIISRECARTRPPRYRTTVRTSHPTFSDSHLLPHMPTSQLVPS